MSGVRAVAARALGLALAVAATVWALSVFTGVYVAGDSMSPALVRGDLTILRRSVEGVRVGDIVLASKAGWSAGILHRVIAVTVDGRYRLRGDANQVPDLDPVPVSSVQGVVVLVVPTGRVIAVVYGLARMVQSRLT
jgi:signal peptidase I